MTFILLFETAGFVFLPPPLQIKDKDMPYVMTWLDLDWGSRSEVFGTKLHLNLPLSHADSEPSNVLYPNSSPNFIIFVWCFTHWIKREIVERAGHRTRGEEVCRVEFHLLWLWVTITGLCWRHSLYNSLVNWCITNQITTAIQGWSLEVIDQDLSIMASDLGSGPKEYFALITLKVPSVQPLHYRRKWNLVFPTISAVSWKIVIASLQTVIKRTVQNACETIAQWTHTLLPAERTEVTQLSSPTINWIILQEIT